LETIISNHEYVKELEVENQVLNQTLRAALPQMVELPERHDAHRMAVELQLRVETLEQLRPEIEELPTDLSGVVELIERIYPDRIVFTPEARKSASDAAFQNIHIAWRLLRSIAVTLFDLCGTKCDLEREYRSRTGFELALTETSATKALREAVRQRTTIYRNRYLMSDAHVKYGSKPPRLLRVHFSIAEVIVVSHVGDHLETAGTRRGRGK
jgi:hypothetical protein